MFFLLIGFLLRLWAVPRFGRIYMQVVGFVGITIGMLILLVPQLTAAASLYERQYENAQRRPRTWRRPAAAKPPAEARMPVGNNSGANANVVALGPAFIAKLNRMNPTNTNATCAAAPTASTRSKRFEWSCQFLLILFEGGSITPQVSPQRWTSVASFGYRLHRPPRQCRADAKPISWRRRQYRARSHPSA